MDKLTLYFLFSYSFICPPVNAEFVDENGQCVYICIDGKDLPCITGPYDDIESLQADKGTVDKICKDYGVCYP